MDPTEGVTTLQVTPPKLPYTIYIIRFLDSRIGHWGLFVPAHNSDHLGRIWHIGFDHNPENNSKDRHSTCLAKMKIFARHHPDKRRYRYEAKSWDLLRNKKNDRTVLFAVRGAKTTWTRMDAAVERVMQDFHYHLTYENCQTFAIDVLRQLRRWDSHMVPQAGIDEVRAMENKYVRMATTVRAAVNPRGRYANERYAVPVGHDRARSRPHFTSMEDEPMPTPQYPPQRSTKENSSSSSESRNVLEKDSYSGSSNGRTSNSSRSSDGMGWAPGYSRREAAPDSYSASRLHVSVMPRDDITTHGSSARRQDRTVTAPEPSSRGYVRYEMMRRAKTDPLPTQYARSVDRLLLDGRRQTKSYDDVLGISACFFILLSVFIVNNLITY